MTPDRDCNSQIEEEVCDDNSEKVYKGELVGLLVPSFKENFP